MGIHPAVQEGAEQGSARVGRGHGTSLPMDVSCAQRGSWPRNTV